MADAPLSRHLLRAKDLADARYFEPLSVADLAAATGHHGGLELPLALRRPIRAGRRRPGADAGARATHARPRRQHPTHRTGGQKGVEDTLFLETDGCQASYDELSSRGVTFNDPPTAQAYGTDTSFRDLSGNNIRLTQVLKFDPARA
jgi:hypothetical protein